MNKRPYITYLRFGLFVVGAAKSFSISPVDVDIFVLGMAQGEVDALKSK